MHSTATVNRALSAIEDGHWSSTACERLAAVYSCVSNSGDRYLDTVLTHSFAYLLLLTQMKGESESGDDLLIRWYRHLQPCKALMRILVHMLAPSDEVGACWWNTAPGDTKWCFFRRLHYWLIRPFIHVFQTAERHIWLLLSQWMLLHRAPFAMNVIASSTIC